MGTERHRWALLAEQLHVTFLERMPLDRGAAAAKPSPPFSEERAGGLSKLKRRLWRNWASRRKGPVISTRGGMGASEANWPPQRHIRWWFASVASPEEKIWRTLRGQTLASLLKEADTWRKIRELLAARANGITSRRNALLNTEAAVQVREVAQNRVLHPSSIVRGSAHRCDENRHPGPAARELGFDDAGLQPRAAGERRQISSNGWTGRGSTDKWQPGTMRTSGWILSSPARGPKH